MTPVIGVITTFQGSDERPCPQDEKVLITGVYRHGVTPDSELCPLQTGGTVYIRSNDLLHRAGGVQPGDGIDVHVWDCLRGRWKYEAVEIENIHDLELFQPVPDNETEDEQ